MTPKKVIWAPPNYRGRWMAKAKSTGQLPALQVPKTVRGEILPPLPARALAKREASNKFKFTKTAIDRVPAPDPSGKQKLYWDEELTGFGLLTSGTTGAKSFIVQRKLDDGRTRRVTVAPVEVLELGAARERAKAILAQFYAGKDPKAARREAARSARGKITLQEALDSYITNKRKKTTGQPLREKTKKEYRALVERHLKAWLNQPLRGISAEMVLEKHAAIKKSVDLGPKTNAQRSVKFTGNSTANGVMVALKAVWNFYRNPGRISDLGDNPVRALDNSSFASKRRTRLVEDQNLPAFYKAVDALPSRAGRDYLKLLLFTGFRRREAAKLQWDHLDFDARVINVPGDITKSGQALGLPMTDFVFDLLSARRDLGREGKYVFAAAGRSGHLEEPKFFLGQVAKATGIRVSPHDLRRGFITKAESTDISSWALKALVNHSVGTGDVTAGYIQLNVERLREPAQRVADKIKALCGIEEKPKQQKGKKKQGRAVP